jgi:hypothetical protein
MLVGGEAGGGFILSIVVIQAASFHPGPLFLVGVLI